MPFNWPITVVLLGCLVLIDGACFADNPQNQFPQLPATRVLLLKNGRIVQGRILASSTGYVVEKSNGRFVIPFDRVKLQAEDVQDAYRKHRKTLPLRSADEHVELAQWCLLNQLFDEARSELLEALRLEPNREPTRRMLRRLEEILNPAAVAKPIVTPQPQRTSDGFQSADAKSLASLSRDSATEFIRSVQPILMNKCATASCHGPQAKDEFRLTRVRLGRRSQRGSVERNLATTLKFIDFENANASPLLVSTKEKHGPKGETLFYGIDADKQMSALRGWVRKVVAEKKAESAGEPLSRPKPFTPITSVGSIPTNQGTFGKRPATVDALKSPSNPPNGAASLLPPANSKPDDANTVRELIREKATDAFDPEVFNRATGNGKQ